MDVPPTDLNPGAEPQIITDPEPQQRPQESAWGRQSVFCAKGGILHPGSVHEPWVGAGEPGCRAKLEVSALVLAGEVLTSVQCPEGQTWSPRQAGCVQGGALPARSGALRRARPRPPAVALRSVGFSAGRDGLLHDNGSLRQ